MGTSDEALLDRLNGHPALRGRAESMLPVVADEMGNLQEAGAAETRLIGQMGREPPQAWAAGASGQGSGKRRARGRGFSGG